MSRWRGEVVAYLLFWGRSSQMNILNRDAIVP